MEETVIPITHYLLIGAVLITAVLLLLTLFRKEKFSLSKPSKKAEPRPGTSPTPSAEHPLPSERGVQYESRYAAEASVVTAERVAAQAAVPRSEVPTPSPIARSEPTVAASAVKREKFVLSVNVMARVPYKFTGYELLQALLSAGFRFGVMSIFHRYSNPNVPSSKILFSIASATEPGTFDINNMGAFVCTGLTLFMQTYTDDALARQHFNLMLETAKQLADELDGELFNDRRQPLTADNVRAYYQRLPAISTTVLEESVTD